MGRGMFLAGRWGEREWEGWRGGGEGRGREGEKGGQGTAKAAKRHVLGR